MDDYRLKRNFMRYLDNHGIRYRDVEDTAIIVVEFEGENIDTISCHLSLVEKNGTVLASVSNYDFTDYDIDLRTGYYACNQANDDALVARFYMDEDGDAVAHMCNLYEGVLDADHLLFTLKFFYNDVDDAYKFLAI